jgi:hypothetical protein
MSIEYNIKETDEHLSSHTGLELVGVLIDRTCLQKRLSSAIISGCVNPEIENSDIIQSMIGLLCLGKPHYDMIEVFRKDPFFIQSLRLTTCPSSSTLRQRLDLIEDSFDHIIKEENALLIKNTAPILTPISTNDGVFIPLDIDVSPFDNSKSKKEGVSRTYKGFDGYAPILAYIGKEGYMINLEHREGKQHCQKGTAEFLMETIWYSRLVTGAQLLVRLDSGNDSKDNIKIFIDEGVDYLIKRNLRKENKKEWLEVAKKEGEIYYTDLKKTIWRGSTYIKIDGINEKQRVIFDITERRYERNGQKLVTPEIQVDTYWTSLSDCPYDIIEMYHKHGESEQFHSELKSDMDLERLPSSKFTTNGLVLLLGGFSYNCLRLFGQISLTENVLKTVEAPAFRRKATRRRVRTVMQDLIYLASHITKSSRKYFLSFGRICHWKKMWQKIYQILKTPVPPIEVPVLVNM